MLPAYIQHFQILALKSRKLANYWKYPLLLIMIFSPENSLTLVHTHCQVAEIFSRKLMRQNSFIQKENRINFLFNKMGSGIFFLSQVRRHFRTPSHSTVCFWSLARSKCLSTFSFYFVFTLWSTSKIHQTTNSFLIN